MARMNGFFGDRRGLAAIDYLFVGLLAWAMRDLSLLYGEAASPIIRHLLHVG